MADEPAGGATPIFLLSFRHRDELAAMAERAGWHTLAARRLTGAERRFVASGASIAVVDARGAFADGMEATRLLADPVEANAGGLLVLLSRVDVARLDIVLEAGATHYLASPFGEAEFGQALRFVARGTERLAGGLRAASGRAELVAAQAETWRWHPHDRDVTISLALAARLGMEAERASLRHLLRALGPAGRRAAGPSWLRRRRKRGAGTRTIAM
jgi:DNA-binding response OmpR family regulator